MTALPSHQPLRHLAATLGRPVAVFLKDAGHGLLEVCHNSLALVGLVVVALSLFFVGRADLRHSLEQSALGWLQTRQEARAEADTSLAGLAVALGERDAVTRATAADLSDLDRQQAAVASWLARRYRVAPEPVSRLVQEAWQVGQRAKLDPTLILAIMAIESSFNPFAQSSVGAQGLMQVMTRVHDDKYEAFGGNHAAFDPVTNLRVGVQVLKECISRAGSLEAGLRYYVGAANLTDDGGYAGKVLAEQSHLRSVAAGRNVAVTAPLIVPPAAVPVVAPAEATAPAAPDGTTEERHAAAQQLALR
ncbi:transglycosylase SLT domain-containing protein [Methylibium sp.]|uniref:transglycosylase SLT domain-containing protein n=1 Tax=Methylibium sp. TaxID=2067992 RepID=UPI003D0E0804